MPNVSIQDCKRDDVARTGRSPDFSILKQVRDRVRFRIIARTISEKENTFGHHILALPICGETVHSEFTNREQTGACPA